MKDVRDPLAEHFDHEGWLLNAIFHDWFSHRKWYRRLTGGTWQKFDGGSPGRPYFFWLRVRKTFSQALETEIY